MKKFLMFAAAALLGVTGCDPAKKPETGISVTDAAGRAVTAPAHPDRIVAIGPGGLRMVSYLESTDKVVGVEGFEHKDFKGRIYRYTFERAKDLPVIGPGGPQSINTLPDTEAVIQAGTQVIFAAHMQADMANKLQERVGIPVVVVSYGPRFATLTEEFFTSLDVMAKILGKEKRASEIRNFYHETLADLEKRVAAAENANVVKPLVYIGGVGFRGAQGITSTDPMFLPLKFLRTNDVAKKHSADKHIFLDQELLLKEDPEIIFIDGLGLRLVREDYAKHPEFYQSLKAFKNNRVYLQLPFNFYTTNLGTAFIGAYSAGKILYPEQFGDIVLRDKGNGIYAFLFGKQLYDQVVADFGDPEKPLVFK